MEEFNANLIRSAIAAGVSIAIYLLLARFGKRAVDQYAARFDNRETAARIQTLWQVARRILLIAVAVVTGIVLFDVWGLGVTPFLAMGTVLAAAVGFGAQDLVKDMIAGLFILVEDQYHIGDTVTIAGVTGTVEDIQLRVTVMRDLEGNVLYVPNGQITVTSNFTSYYAQPVVDVGIAYEEDVDRAIEVLEDELNRLAQDREWSGRIDGPPEVLGVNELADSSVVLRARLTTDAVERWTVRREALRRVKNRFDAEGISIPFPQVTVHRAE